MSLSCDKENNQFKLTTVPPQNTSQHTDWVQCIPATPAPASCKAWKASWKPTDDELLLECLRKQQANPFTGVTRCDKLINRLPLWVTLLGIRFWKEFGECEKVVYFSSVTVISNNNR